MDKSSTVRARVNPELKQDVEGVLGTLGMSMSEAINIFMSQIKLHNGLPFEVKVPNSETKKVLDESDQGLNLHSASSVDDLFNQLSSDDNCA